MNHYLSIILFTPLAGALLLLLVPKQSENAIRWIANVTALAGFGISVPLWFWYNPQGAEFQFTERAPWIPSIGADYFIGVDGLSTLLILLTTMMGFIAILSSWNATTERVKEYYIFLLVLQSGMLGAFMALDFGATFFGSSNALLPIYAKDILHVGPIGLGLLYAAASMGALVAATERFKRDGTL